MASPSIQWATDPSQREEQLLSVIEELQQQVKELRESKLGRQPRQVLPEPERFSGRVKDWDTWSTTMRAKLRVDGKAIGDASAQLYYVYSSLKPSVQGLVLPFVQKAERIGSWDPLTMLEHLGRTYNDPNKAKKAGQRLRDLQQGTMSTVAYLPRFERTLFEAGAEDWPDNAKITTLVGGLNKETKQRLDAQLTLPSEYDAFVRTLLTLSNQFDFRHNEQGSNAMDWERTKVSKGKIAPAVSREQRQRWRDDGRCVRCGSKEHWVQQCQFRPTQSRSSSKSSLSSEANVRIGNSKAMVRVGRLRTTAKRTKSLGSMSDLDDLSDGTGYSLRRHSSEDEEEGGVM
jgi:hypothetical protein